MLTAMRCRSAGAFLVLVLAGCTSMAGSQLSRLISRHTASRGGAERIEAVQRIRFDIEVEEPAFKVDVRYVADRTGRVRVDVFHEGKRVFSEGVDREGGWQAGEDGVSKPMSADGRKAIEHGRVFNLYGLHEYERLGHRLSMQPREMIDGRAYEVVMLVFNDGFETWRGFDAETGLLAFSRDFRPLHPDIDPKPVWIESRYSDDREIEGVVFPFASRQEVRGTGEWLQSSRIRSIEINPDLGDGELQRL